MFDDFFYLGIPSVLIRFGCHIPFGMLCTSALHLYHAAEKSQPLKPAYGQHLITGMTLLGVMGTFGFAWNFITFLIAAVGHPYVLLVLGVMDAAIAASLLSGSAIEAPFVPHSAAPCSNSTAPTWREPAGYPNMFVLLARETNDYPAAVCDNIRKAWILGYILGGAYTLNAAYCILAGVFGCCKTNRNRSGNYNYNQPQRRNCLGAIINFPRKIAISAWAGATWAVRLVFNLPGRVVHPTWRKYRINRRISEKRAERKAEIAAAQEKRFRELALSKTESFPPPYQRDSKDVHPLARALTPDVLLNVARRCDYVDILNLSRTSKLMRQAIFPPGEKRGRAHFLRACTCAGNERGACRGCGAPVCEECRFTETVDPPELYARHKGDPNHFCVPACTPCVRAAFADRAPRLGLRCDCEVPEPEPEEEEWHLCRNCYYRPGNYGRFMEREADAQALRLKKEGENVTCYFCSGRIPFDKVGAEEEGGQKQTVNLRNWRDAEAAVGGDENGADAGGPRWWVCRVCRKECRGKHNGQSVHAEWWGDVDGRVGC